MSGKVVGLYTTPGAEQTMVSRETVEAIPGVGLAGDRYSNRAGTYSDKPGIDRQVTLIESEVLDAVSGDLDAPFGGLESRRNVVTAGISLNPLVGQRFRVGAVLLRGVRLCEPCAYLERITGLPVLVPLVNRGGLRAEILEGGSLRVGDVIAAEAQTEAGPD